MEATALKIADFGMAVRVEDSEHGVIENNKYQEYVTLWYRAPELLMGRTSYNCFAVDVWSMGCIFAKMFIGEPLFRGQSVKEQLDIIFPNPGKPFPSLTRFVKNVGCLEGVDLLKQMLQVDGNKRITAKEALQHPYFQCYKSLDDNIIKIEADALSRTELLEMEAGAMKLTVIKDGTAQLPTVYPTLAQSVF